ncbi:HAD family phosphatase [Phenylobacterium sp. LjRoot219]|uniref:HAD family hydrolase n=1 Tax=Phenylobacterium sp. LjRoot219 TaxID=3342283 RepID=UPI003ECD46F5
MTRVAAFDVDGTILRGQSQVYFAKMLVRRRIAGAGLMARVLWWYALMRLGVPFDQAKAQRTVIGSLAGAPQAWIDEVLATFVSEALAPNLRPGALAEIDRLRAAGCRILLVSAAPSPIISRLAEHLGLDGYVATEVAPPVDGRFSGQLVGASVMGGEKVLRLQSYAAEAFGQWELHAAYGDQDLDGPLLALARHPVAVCPTRELAQMAAARGWPVRQW